MGMGIKVLIYIVVRPEGQKEELQVPSYFRGSIQVGRKGVGSLVNNDVVYDDGVRNRFCNIYFVFYVSGRVNNDVIRIKTLLVILFV